MRVHELMERLASHHPDAPVEFTARDDEGTLYAEGETLLDFESSADGGLTIILDSAEFYRADDLI